MLDNDSCGIGIRQSRVGRCTIKTDGRFKNINGGQTKVKKIRLLIAAAAAAMIITVMLAGCNDKGRTTSQEEPEISEVSVSFSDGSDISSEEIPPEDEPDSSFSEEDVQAVNPDFLQIAGLDNTAQGWGQGVRLLEDNRPEAAVYFQEKYGSYGARFIGENNRNIYLTFDEGYENGYTEKILDTLKEKEVTAVFFITNSYARNNPELVLRMIREGHIIGNHSYYHKSYPSLSLEEAAQDLGDMHNYVLEHFGYRMWLFRPPEGAYSERTLALAQQMGYESVFWSFAYKDWDVDNQIGREAAYEQVSAHAHPGAIFLLHAVSKDNSEILGDIIDNFREQGYTLAKYDL